MYFYISGVLENGIEDFQNGEEIFEAIGEVLLQLDDSKTESDIKLVCSFSYSSRRSRRWMIIIRIFQNFMW